MISMLIIFLVMQNSEQSIGFLISDTARLMRRRFDQRARHLGLTRAQWQVLAHLQRNEGINQIGLADLLDIEAITLCRTIDRMEEGGWVERRADPNDRRARLLFLTERARPFIADMRVIAEEIYAEALSGLPADTRQTLTEILTAMRTNLSARPALADSPKAKRA
jgi:MarR family transcriptional regulator, transcriptional regulator for hemolysin